MTVLNLMERPVNPILFYLSNLSNNLAYSNQAEVDPAVTSNKIVSIGSARARRLMAEHPRTDIELLLKLAEDSDPEVRLAAAENAKMPYFALRRLAKDPCLDIRLGMAENSNLPAAILELLTLDDNPYIETMARVSLARNIVRQKA